MISGKLRALSVALALGTASLSGIVAMTGTAQAQASVRATIGKPLQQAQALAAKGDYKGAMAEVNKAEAVGDKTAAETRVIGQMRDYISSKSGNASVYEQQIASGKGNAAVARNLIRSYYMQRDYAKVIRNADTARRFGATDSGTQTLIAQAYYLSGDYAGTIRFLKGRTDLDSVKLTYSAAFKLKDMPAIQTSLGQLIAATGDAQYWRGGIEIAEGQRPLSDHQSLNLLRLRNLTDTMRPSTGGDDDYSLTAQIAIQLGFPGEAQAILQKGMDAKIVTGERAKRLMNMAKTQAAAKKASLAADEAKAKTGDELVKLGETYWGFGEYKKAQSLIEAGIKKGVSKPVDAQIVLGLTMLSQGQRDQATRAFAAAPKEDAKASVISNLFHIYARSNGGKKKS